MARYTRPLISGHFATGVVHYEDYYLGQTDAIRIVLPVILAGELKISAIVDTGAPWCVLNPRTAALTGLDALTPYQPVERFLVRGIWYRGHLFRIPLNLEANEGENLEVEATVFIATLRPNEMWLHPNFIGLDGFLNRIRFAIDPAENAFYFGLA